MNEHEELIKLRQVVDACCLRMGVEDGASLYSAIADADEAIKAFILDGDDSKLRAWWKSRDF